MSDTAPAVPVTAMSKIDEAVEKIREAQNLCGRLIANAKQGEAITPRHLEDIDDRLHDALAALGE